MAAILVGLLLVAAVTYGLSKASSYGASLEDFIRSKNPTSVYDVEKYTREYEARNTRGFL